MKSQLSIFATFALAAALCGQAHAAGSNPSAQSGVSTAMPAMASTGAAVMPAALFAAGAGSVTSVPHAASFGAAAATGEEALPESNLAMLLLAAAAAMGSVVIRRSGMR